MLTPRVCAGGARRTRMAPAHAWPRLGEMTLSGSRMCVLILSVIGYRLARTYLWRCMYECIMFVACTASVPSAPVRATYVYPSHHGLPGSPIRSVSHTVALNFLAVFKAFGRAKTTHPLRVVLLPSQLAQPADDDETLIPCIDLFPISRAKVPKISIVRSARDLSRPP